MENSKYEKPVVEVMQAEDLVESLGATAATWVSDNRLAAVVS